MKGSDIALMDHCTDAQSIAVGSRIVGEHLMDIRQDAYITVQSKMFFILLFPCTLMYM